MSAFEAFLQTHPVFTTEDFEGFQRSRGSRSRSTRRTILARQEEKGRILRVRRGLYVAIPYGESPDEMAVESYLVASRLAPDAVLAYHTAAEFHGKANSVFTDVQYLTRTTSRMFAFRDLRFRPVRVPRALCRQGADRFGVEVHKRGGLDVAVTSFERTTVDLLDRLDLSGGFEEVWHFLEAVGFLDLDAVASYVELLGSATTAAKVGYCLERFRDALAVDEPTLGRLELRRPKSPHYVHRNRKLAHRFISRWNLLVPETVEQRSWEGVGDDR